MNIQIFILLIIYLQYLSSSGDTAEAITAINQFEETTNEKKPSRAKTQNDTLDVFLNFDEVNQWMIESSKMEMMAQLELIGKTYQNRPTYMMKISTNHSAMKPIVFIEAGMHAREWAAPASALYLIKNLLQTDQNKIMLKTMDWYIIPVLNGDGYQFTHSNQKNRNWRKTLSKKGNCTGVDGNRNFDFHWGESGVSRNPCSEIYPGPSPFSEKETKNLRDVGKKYKGRIHTFISMHAFGSYILYPWGYMPKKAKNWQIMEKCGHLAANAIEKVEGTKYSVGNTAELLYNAAGGSDDYFLGVLKALFAYTIELRSGGKTGFDLPPEKLPGVMKETFEGIKALVNCTSQYKFRGRKS